jgi:glutamate--cysteine ligase
MSSTVRARAQRVESYLRAQCFRAPAPGAPLCFGAELELLALDAATHRVAPIRAPDGRGTHDAACAVAARRGWMEQRSDKGASRFIAPGGGALTFEPGGQLEYASAVHSTIDAVVDELAAVQRLLEEHADERGIMLVAVGVDPENGPADAPLQLQAERYRRMAAYFDSLGCHGARMMRQTASLQLCLGGGDPMARWRVANAIAPWLVALFANSPRYAGRDTGCASYRAETWRGVDPRRTGIFQGCDPVREYAAFALAAPAFLAGAEGDAPVPFGALHDDAASDAALATHLSTLFPEVRPRGYLELRSIDALDATQHAAAMVFAAGIVCDDVASADALELLGDPSPELLHAAGRSALADPLLGLHASDLIEIAIAGGARQGSAMVSEPLLDVARSVLTRRASSTPAWR